MPGGFFSTDPTSKLLVVSREESTVTCGVAGPTIQREDNVLGTSLLRCACLEMNGGSKTHWVPSSLQSFKGKGSLPSMFGWLGRVGAERKAYENYVSTTERLVYISNFLFSTTNKNIAKGKFSFPPDPHGMA